MSATVAAVRLGRWWMLSSHDWLCALADHVCSTRRAAAWNATPSLATARSRSRSTEGAGSGQTSRLLHLLIATANGMVRHLLMLQHERLSSAVWRILVCPRASHST